MILWRKGGWAGLWAVRAAQEKADTHCHLGLGFKAGKMLCRDGEEELLNNLLSEEDPGFKLGADLLGCGSVVGLCWVFCAFCHIDPAGIDPYRFTSNFILSHPCCPHANWQSVVLYAGDLDARQE